MARKKWTPNSEVTDSLLKSREKRKWQLAFRRYVLEKMPAQSYSQYFGLDIENLRKWIELQFTGSISWENFGSDWQFDHIIPVAYFDYSNEEDLKLCWNFINIRIEELNNDKNDGPRINVLAAKSYFQALYNKTDFTPCLRMIDKIKNIEAGSLQNEPRLENFIIGKKQYLETLSTLNSSEFNSLNTGTSLDDILMEKQILEKFGS